MTAGPEKLAVVTGAEQGIGLSIVEALRREAFSVIALAGPNELIDDLAGLNPLKILQLDFRRRGFETKLEECLTQLNLKPDVLVNNAGRFRRATLSDIDRDLLSETFDVNVIAPLLLSQVFSKHRSANRMNYIINIASDAAMIGTRKGIHYSSSKGALISMTKSLAKHFRGQNVTVNAIVPGVTRTRQSFKSEHHYQVVAKETLVGRIAEPSDIADSVLAIAMGKLDYMTGGILNLTGGRYL